MTHLGDRVSALVDGQLPLDAVERAHAHLAHCRGCRDAVEAERLMKGRLSCLPAPEPASDLVGRLLAMGGPAGPLPPRPGHVPGSPRPAPVVAWSAPPEFATVSVPVAAPALAVNGGPFRTASRPVPRGSSRPAGRPGSVRGLRPRPGRPSGRPALLAPERASRRWTRLSQQRARLAGALLGTLGVVGAGVSGLLLIPPEAADAPARAPLDSFVVQRPVVTPTLNLNPRPPKTAMPVSSVSITSTAVTSSTAFSSPGGR